MWNEFMSFCWSLLQGKFDRRMDFDRTRLKLAALRAGITTMLLALFILGCGGGDDFSKPPSGVAERLSKVSEQTLKPAPVPPTSDSITLKNDSTELKKNAAVGEAAGQSGSAESPVIAVNAADEVKVTTSGKVDDATPSMNASEGPPESDSSVAATMAEGQDSKSSVPSKPMPPAAPTTAVPGGSKPIADVAKKPDNEETMTASGRSAKSIADKKDENSEMTVAENAGGLLGSLKSNKGPAGEKNTATPVDDDAPAALTQFGRMALSQPDWLKLVTRLSRRFYVGTSLDGTRILASSGERSGGVVQIETIPELQGRYGTREAQDELVQSVASLPGQVSCVELTSDGNTALFGTEDGRVLVRLISGKHSWDLYARDLFLFQDEIRPSARLSADPILLIREIDGGQLLSVDSKGQGAIWKIGDVIQSVPPIETISSSDIASLNSTAVEPTPVSKFEVKGLQILSCCESVDGLWVAIISSDETVTIIQTASGHVIDQLTAAQFADTQPVCVAFLPQRQEILVGLADGRILRRSFGKDATPVSGVSDTGEPVDYDSVFIPDVKDRPDSITAITPIPGSNFAYVGSITGSISRLDVSQRRMEMLPSKQAGAVIELKVCSYGALAIGDERRATIFDQPISLITRQAPAVRTLELPTDEALKETNSSDLGISTARRPPTRSASLREPPIDQEMIGIRPPQPEIALLHHQLRSATDQERRQTVRSSILQLQGKSDKLLTAPVPATNVDDKVRPEPTLLSEFTADFQFSGRAWQDVRMTLSQDGRIAVLSHSSRPGISVVDMPTGVVLRRWTAVPDARRLLLNERFGRLLPSGPVSAELSLVSGALMTDPMRRYLVCAVSPDEKATVIGHFGKAGMAAHALTRIDDLSTSRVNAVEMFESMVTALAYSSNGESLYASFRSRDQTTLQELDPTTLTVRATLITEPLSGAVPAEPTEALNEPCGVTFVQTSATNKSLMTFGTHEDGPQLRLWKRSSKGWPKENVQIFNDKDVLPDPEFFQPVVFVNQLDSTAAVVTATGLAILNVKKEKLESYLPIPDVGSRRPSGCFSPDARWFVAGDPDGKIWVISLANPAKKPLTFQAHSGPVAGVAISSNGKYMLTVGEDNRIRCWSLGEFMAQ